jgi:hypothetical protein
MKRKILQTHTVEIKLVDFSKDKDEPAYDVEVWINGEPTMGGGLKQIYGIGIETPSYQYPTKGEAFTAASLRIINILAQIKKIGEE